MVTETPHNIVGRWGRKHPKFVGEGVGGSGTIKWNVFHWGPETAQRNVFPCPECIQIVNLSTMYRCFTEGIKHSDLRSGRRSREQSMSFAECRKRPEVTSFVEGLKYAKETSFVEGWNMQEKSILVKVWNIQEWRLSVSACNSQRKHLRLKAWKYSVQCRIIRS